MAAPARGFVRAGSACFEKVFVYFWCFVFCLVVTGTSTCRLMRFGSFERVRCPGMCGCLLRPFASDLRCIGVVVVVFVGFRDVVELHFRGDGNPGEVVVMACVAFGSCCGVVSPYVRVNYCFAIGRVPVGRHGCTRICPSSGTSGV